MRISRLKILRASGGWRPFSFLKIVTDEGINGWAEFVEGSWSSGLSDAITGLGELVLGEDPRQFARTSAKLRAITRFAAGGLNHQAIAAIENASLDIAAKALGVPVYGLFGGPFRQAIDLYWSHCGTFRVAHGEFFERVLERPRLRTLDDMRSMGRQVVSAGYKAAKTNPIVFGPSGPRLLNPGFVARGLGFGRGVNEATVRGMAEQAIALREGLGPDCDLMFDVNFGYRQDALKRIADALAPVRLAWMEADLDDPEALREVRARSQAPVASLESLHGRREYLPYFRCGAVDVAIIDVPWNGLCEAVRIAALAETHDTNVAPHNFYGPLADLMSGHFCAAVGNVSIMESEADDVPWKQALLTRPYKVAGGQLHIPSEAGWGADIDEDAVKAHPWS